MKKGLKVGCLGCLGLAGMAVALVALALSVTWVQLRSESVEERSFAQPLPAGSGTPLEPGRLVVDLAYGDMRIEPAAPGEPLSVEGRYDTDDFRLDGRYEASGETGWVYRLSLVSAGRVKFQGLRELLGGTPPEVRVRLPRGVPMAVEGRIAQGKSTSELGGLWLTSVDLALDEGDHRLDFGEPLHAPLSRLDLRTGKGQIAVTRVGNASPRELEVDHSMGQLDLDLRGDWRSDSEVRVQGSMGQITIDLPAALRVEGLDDVRVILGEYHGPAPSTRPAADDAPTLTLDLSVTMGGLDVRR